MFCVLYLKQVVGLVESGDLQGLDAALDTKTTELSCSLHPLSVSKKRLYLLSKNLLNECIGCI